MQPDTRSWEPRRPGLVAGVVFAAAALTLCWPMLTGQFLAGPASDQYVAGYAFRNFAAEYWRAHHAVPLWNPYIFGGMPYVGGMHGDIFYPTAWLRWILPTGPAMNLGFALHLVLAGAGMYALLRGLRAGWTGALVGGLSYELTGMVASLVHPGHDGKLFVSALAPLLLLALLRGIRQGRVSAFGAAALIVGLSLHGHPQLSYYLLVAAGLWTLFLAFGADGPVGGARWRALGLAAVAVAVGAGIYAVQALPFAAYIPFSPRAAGGPSGGWEYATAYSFPPAELFSAFYPELNGLQGAYLGANGLKHHTEHLGAVVVLLALCGFGGATSRRERAVLGAIGILFLLVSFGGHTPFYRLWYELMPMMKKVRAPGMAFFLVSLPVSLYAGFGAERLLAGQVTARRVLIGAGVFGFLGIVGAAGGLLGLAEALARPELAGYATQLEGGLRSGGLRLLLVVAAGAGAVLAVRTGRVRGAAAAAALALVVTADLWSMDRKFFVFGGTPAQLFGNDSLTTVVRKAPMPYRLWDPKGQYEQGLGTWPGSWLMGADVPQLFGYHGNELRSFDELWGGKNLWANQANPLLLRLFAIRFVALREAQSLPGYHQVAGPAATTPGGSGVLYEADTLPPYVRLMAGAVKAPEAQVAQIVADPRFPVLDVAVYPEEAAVQPADLGSQVPPAAAAQASVRSWDAGAITVALEGRDDRPLYLVVAENWYKDWQATVDGRPAPVLKAQHTLLSVVVPPGAKEVAFVFRSREYERGKLISLLSLVLAAGMAGVPRLVGRKAAAHA